MWFSCRPSESKPFLQHMNMGCSPSWWPPSLRSPCVSLGGPGGTGHLERSLGQSSVRMFCTARLRKCRWFADLAIVTLNLTLTSRHYRRAQM